MYANNIGEAKQPGRYSTEYHAQAQEVAQIHPLCHKPTEEHEECIGEKVGGVQHAKVGLG